MSDPENVIHHLSLPSHLEHGSDDSIYLIALYFLFLWRNLFLKSSQNSVINGFAVGLLPINLKPPCPETVKCGPRSVPQLFFENVTHLMLWGIQETVSRSFSPRWGGKSHTREAWAEQRDWQCCKLERKTSVSFEFCGRFFCFYMIPRHSLS